MLQRRLKLNLNPMIPNRQIHVRAGGEDISPLRRKHDVVINRNVYAPRNLRVKRMTPAGTHEQISRPGHGLHVSNATLDQRIRPVKTQPPINPRDRMLPVGDHTQQPRMHVGFVRAQAR